MEKSVCYFKPTKTIFYAPTPMVLEKCELRFGKVVSFRSPISPFPIIKWSRSFPTLREQLEVARQIFTYLGDPEKVTYLQFADASAKEQLFKVWLQELPSSPLLSNGTNVRLRSVTGRLITPHLTLSCRHRANPGSSSDLPCFNTYSHPTYQSLEIISILLRTLPEEMHPDLWKGELILWSDYFECNIKVYLPSVKQRDKRVIKKLLTFLSLEDLLK